MEHPPFLVVWNVAGGIANHVNSLHQSRGLRLEARARHTGRTPPGAGKQHFPALGAHTQAAHSALARFGSAGSVARGAKRAVKKRKSLGSYTMSMPPISRRLA